MKGRTGYKPISCIFNLANYEAPLSCDRYASHYENFHQGFECRT